MIDLDLLESLHQATTPGPWTVRRREHVIPSSTIQALRLDPKDPHDIEIISEDDTTLYPTREADLAWVVAAHEAFPAMLDELARYRALIAKGAGR